ncbi:ABC-three component system middle component 8 [Peptoclostridium acidaminophilum]|uniref:ABC-three component system middle component 8 n=1 Tax=Peptoclostridium acidaminophilum TaxID=1731 RepID=UPI001A9A3F57|nr:ABC-three component system middle component 8 [Peptoclostridium acidaminophilum]
MNLENCVISICVLILKILKDVEIIKYNDLYNIVFQIKGENMKYNFIPALDFLFLLGKLQYYPETDTLELIE